MIRLESVSKSYPNGVLFNNVNISINKGMRVGLVGKNGSGKSTLLKLILKEERPDTGSIQIQKALKIGYLSQDVVEESGLSVMDEVKRGYPKILELEKKVVKYNDLVSKNPTSVHYSESLGKYQTNYEALGGWNLEKKINSVLSGLGFRDHQLKMSMKSFSGGWRMRVALAKILIKDPDILFLDEPTNHLDLDAIIWLESFISKWSGSLILISHDRAFLDRAINNILEIDLKKVVLYKGNYSDYKRSKKLRFEQHRASYKNQIRHIQETERFIERFRYKSSKAVQVQSRIKSLQKLDRIEAPEEDKKKIILNLPTANRSPLKVARLEKIKKMYSNISVFDDISFVVERGDKFGLVGQNGAGKSTLLKMLAKVESINGGEFILGDNVKTAYYSQHQLEILNYEDTVFDCINNKNTGKNETEIRTFLGAFLFSGSSIDKKVNVLSGGEKARLALASILVQPVHFLLLDEPTNHLDMVSRSVLEEALIKFTGSIICISHDRHFLNKVTNKICEVDKKHLKIYDGNYDYYVWKKAKKQNVSIVQKPKKKVNKKTFYLDRKKVKNRIKWIEKSFNQIESKIEKLRLIQSDPRNGDNYEVLNDAMGKMSALENEYLNLMEEHENLKNTFK